jgi:hypothetical protein
MWYRKALQSSMSRLSSSPDELWKAVQDTDLDEQNGISDAGEFREWTRDLTPEKVRQISQRARGNPAIAKPLSDLVAGRFLSQEIARTMETAWAEGREPSVAEMRAARNRANERMQTEGLDAGSPQFQVGKRGPLTRVPRLTEQPGLSPKDVKRENLNLESPLDVDPGNVPIPVTEVDPSDDTIPEEAEIERHEQEQTQPNEDRKSLQMQYPTRPPLHDRCHCSVRDLGGGMIWETHGDPCPECRQHQQAFNALGNSIGAGPNMPTP